MPARHAGRTAYTYDGANRIITEVQNGQTVVYVYVIPSGLRTISYPGGSIVTESNDARAFGSMSMTEVPHRDAIYL